MAYTQVAAFRISAQDVSPETDVVLTEVPGFDQYRATLVPLLGAVSGAGGPGQLLCKLRTEPLGTLPAGVSDLFTGGQVQAAIALPQLPASAIPVAGSVSGPETLGILGASRLIARVERSGDTSSTFDAAFNVYVEKFAADE